MVVFYHEPVGIQVFSAEVTEALLVFPHSSKIFWRHIVLEFEPPDSHFLAFAPGPVSFVIFFPNLVPVL